MFSIEVSYAKPFPMLVELLVSPERADVFDHHDPGNITIEKVYIVTQEGVKVPVFDQIKIIDILETDSEFWQIAEARALEERVQREVCRQEFLYDQQLERKANGDE